MADIPTLFIGLAQNIALLLSLVFVYSLVTPRLNRVPLGVRGVITGALFGVIALIGMMVRIQVAPGVNFDSRNVAVALAGVFGGAASAAMAGSLVGAYRLWLGGPGAIPGVGAILTATALGAWVHCRWGSRVQGFGPRHFLLLGAALAVSGLPWTFALPDPDLARRVLGVFVLPVGVLYPIATMLAGMLLVRDITARRRAEEEAERRVREAEVLADLVSSINTSLDVSTILQRAAEGAKDLCGSDMAAVALRSPASEETVLRYRVGTRYQGYESNPIQPGKGAGGQVLLSGRPFRTDNYAEDPRISKEYLPVVQEEEVVAVLVVPIRIGECVEGLLYVTNRSPRPFTDRDEAILLRLADHAAVAIENARLYGEAEQRRQAAEGLAEAGRVASQSLDPEEVAKRIVESLRTLAGARASTLYRLEPETGDLVAVAVSGDVGPAFGVPLVFPRGTGVVGLAVHHRKPMTTPNVLTDPRVTLTSEIRTRIEQAEYRSVLAVPLVVKNLVVGALGVGDREGRVFESEQIRLAQAFANQAALALENARLYTEALRRRREAEELVRVGRLLAESLDVSVIGERIVESVLPLFGVQASNLRLFQPDGSSMAIASGGLARRRFGPGQVQPAGVGLSERVATEGRPVWSRDLANDSRMALAADVRDLVTSVGIHAALAVPLRVKGKIIGVLIIGDQRMRDFSDAEVALLQSFADQGAVALENSRLYKDLRAALEEVEVSQRHVIETERLRALGELAGGVAHNFNNALAIVLGRVELLLARARSPDVRRQLTVIEQTAKDAARIVKRIEEFARMRQARPFRAVDLNQLVGEVVELTRPRWKEEAKANWVSYEVITEKASLPPVAGDPSELREALTNLMFNALDAMPTGGRVTFRTGTDGEHAYCAVTDTGIGMPPEVRQRIFDPFFTTKGERGSGLGLSIVYGIIARHGGKVDAESQVGEGTTFTIRLPLGRKIAEVSEEVSPPRPQRSGKILVIDDEPELLEVLRELLVAEGHAVTACLDGESGLSRFQGEPFDLVITDLGMPGLSGWEVVNIIKDRRPETPVALLTGWADQIAPEEAQAKGADFLIAKPFMPEDIQAVLAQALASKN